MARLFPSPSDAGVSLGGACPCGRHGNSLICNASTPAEDAGSQLVEAVVARAVFGADTSRRRLLRSVGGATALGALAQFFPLAAAKEAFAQAPGTLEKRDVKIGFIPITCATPIIMAAPMGFYARQGLNAEVVKTAGWAIIRDKSLNGEYDAAHMLAPMPLAISMGVGATAGPWTAPAIENINGQAIILAMKHKIRRDPREWKGMTFGIPFEFSMHNYLLRYYLAEHGVDPDRDVQLRVVDPPEMVSNLLSGNFDGFLGPDPINQRAVYDGLGFVHLLSREIWDGHPCCSFSISRDFVQTAPNTYHAMLRAIVEATAYAAKNENRREIAAAIAPANYLNQPEIVVQQALTGTFADGLGKVQHVPDRVSFAPMPWDSFAIWILTQMKRWGQVRGDVDYATIARQVYLATDARAAMRDAGMEVPEASGRTIVVMGKPFDPSEPTRYVDSFAIRRS
jgi:nitrate/nitrite transport system substrate-binding protein